MTPSHSDFTESLFSIPFIPNDYVVGSHGFDYFKPVSYYYNSF